MLIAPAKAESRLQPASPSRRLPDGRWCATSPAAPDCPLLHDVQVFGLLPAELERAAALLADARADLHGMVAALSRREFAVVDRLCTNLAPTATELREVLVASHLQDPSHLPTQRALGLVCLAAGRHGEARFHLLRSVPGQYHLFAVGPRLELLRPHPEMVGPVVLAAAALEFTDQAPSARRLLTNLRDQLTTLQLAERLRGLPPHVLWRHPEVLRHVRGVLQVGANVGDELPCWHALGLPALVAFEPVPAAFAQLEQGIARQRPPAANWRALRMAIGDHIGTLPFWVGEHTGNSSFLPLHPDRSEFHQQNRHAERIAVPTTTLDAWAAADPAAAAACNLLFLDVQGTEHLVLLGARTMLRGIDFVVLELSDTEIYAGSWTAPRMAELLAELGFVELDRASSGFPEQFDALYVRPRRDAPLP